MVDIVLYGTATFRILFYFQLRAQSHIFKQKQLLVFKRKLKELINLMVKLTKKIDGKYLQPLLVFTNITAFLPL